MAIYEDLVPRFLRYVKSNTRSDPDSYTIPSTPRLIAFAKKLAEEMQMIGLKNVHYLDKNGYVVGTLPSNQEKKVPVIGFMGHMDTAEFNSENVNPQFVPNYDGQSLIKLDQAGKFTLNLTDFPFLANYKGHDLITTDGSTLLGGDDKAGVAEIMTAMAYLVKHPEIKHGEIRVGFSPDEEIGTGADHFDVADFNATFAYTVDGGSEGQLEYETFNAAEMKVHIQGKNVHTATANGVMVNALQLATDFQNGLPQKEVPEKTSGTAGFFHLYQLKGTVEEADMTYIIRDFKRSGLQARKEVAQRVAATINARFPEERISLTIFDQYYNMREVLEKDMRSVELAKKAMEEVGVKPLIDPVRGGTDGSKISFMGLPTPNLFAGPENMHGRYEFVSEQVMARATDVILQIIKLNSQ
ncbi:peptidase T [Loigolactobacillus backii]|uniref:peptidase T n=1 Tax=Loigolactobacillus backii TaxID=375175 RepID=UPI0007F08706|nr:peptidase T [Loigolactobacillus backii]ANK59588.1 peptidase T [Loigolactobacillus backii]ANK64582.1 peptidase T [Loigolactobacillus backii]ANK67023.1 peptidase T [Loigolactobacillus backii]OLF70731.1 peptidase T [Loigolactobacillus backii]PIO87667.1 peptidase T [Loigolactobacillus backii]